jgi:FMN phosphatase YigB (HAD superfamily)
MVGDNLRHDVYGALDAGLGAVWLNWKDRDVPEDGRNYGVASDMEGVRELLERRLE